MSNALAESAAGTIGDLFGEPSAPEPELAPVPEPEDDELTLAPAADLSDIWDDDPEASTTTIEGVDVDELGPDELRAQVVKLARKAEYEKNLRVQTGIKAWRIEATEKLPFSRPTEIVAESRAEFMRQAQAQDQAARQVIQPFLDKVKAREATLRASIEAEVRAEYEKGWGTPTLASGPGVPVTADANERLKGARKRRDLKGVTKALMDGGVF